MSLILGRRPRRRPPWAVPMEFGRAQRYCASLKPNDASRHVIIPNVDHFGMYSKVGRHPWSRIIPDYLFGTMRVFSFRSSEKSQAGDPPTKSFTEDRRVYKQRKFDRTAFQNGLCAIKARSRSGCRFAGKAAKCTLESGELRVKKRLVRLRAESHGDNELRRQPFGILFKVPPKFPVLCFLVSRLCTAGRSWRALLTRRWSPPSALPALDPSQPPRLAARGPDQPEGRDGAIMMARPP